MEAAVFAQWQTFLMQRTGIHLQESKRYLIENRLNPLLRIYGFDCVQGLLEAMTSEPGGSLEHEVVELMTTHETSFFRDPGGFELLKFAFKKWSHGRAGTDATPFRIWSAGCSTGEEVYSIIMTLLPMMRRFRQPPLQILGTDIAPHTIEAAQKGVYRDLRNKVSQELLDSYFEPVAKGWQVKASMRRFAKFEERNLFELPQRMRPFDVIFCRNVAIYFQVQYRAKLFADLAERLQPGGFLVLGGSESMFGVQHTFKRVLIEGSYFYQKL